MVTAPPKLEVRSVGPEAFDDIYPLLLSFRNRKMSRDDWHRMLFSYPWWTGDTRGFALYAGGVAVGFMGTIFSNRRLAGRDEVFCNASCWIVRKEYRNASIMLLKPLLAMRDRTIVNLTPTVRSYDIFKKLGFKPLETEQLLLAPVANFLGLPGGSFTTVPNDFDEHLSEPERAIHRGLATSPAVVHLLLRRGGERCYLVATVKRIKRVPFAELHYVGNLDFFWRNRALAHVAVLRAMGAAGIIIDARFAGGRRVAFAGRLPAKRLYRPAQPDVPPEAIDNLFSELMVLKI